MKEKNMSLAKKITDIAKTFPGFVRAGIGLEHEVGFWDNVFECADDGGWLRVVFTNQAAYRAFADKLRVALPKEAEIERQTAPYVYKSPVSAEERIIRANHDADVTNGLTEQEASESDAFERRVLGMDDDNFQGGRYGDAGYSGCYD